MSTKHHISLDDVRGAKPTFRPTAEEWVDSERGREVLERVLAADRAAHATVYRTQSRRRAWLTVPRLAFAGGFVVIAALAVALTLTFTGHGGSPGVGPVASTPASVDGGQLTTQDIVSDLMPLYMAIVYQTADLSTSDTSRVDQAVEFGLIPQDKAGKEALAAPMTNGEYATLLVKAFRTLLWQSIPSTGTADSAPMTDQRAAIRVLGVAGVILPADGEFDPGQTLTKATEQRLLGRIQHLFNAATGQ